jgi:ABC-type multidrug transport system ATPase subunit
MNTLLKASNLGLYGVGYNWVFKDINLQIKSGEITIIYGNISSGKTLLTDILCGLKKPSKGLVERNAAVAVATQEFTLYKDLTVRENLDFICTINNISPIILSDIINLTGLTGWETIKALKLPAGLKKMLQIDCAIVQKTPVLIFDEPTSGLDSELNNKLWLLLDKLAQEGRGIIIMTNQMVKEVSVAQVFNLTTHGLIVMSNSNTSNNHRFENESKGVSL